MAAYTHCSSMPEKTDQSAERRSTTALSSNMFGPVYLVPPRFGIGRRRFMRDRGEVPPPEMYGSIGRSAAAAARAA